MHGSVGACGSPGAGVRIVSYGSVGCYNRTQVHALNCGAVSPTLISVFLGYLVS